MVYQNPEDMFIKDSIEKDISYAMDVRGSGRSDRTNGRAAQKISAVWNSGSGMDACFREDRCAGPAWRSASP